MALDTNCRILVILRSTKNKSCDPLALVDGFTPVEDNIGLLETRFNVEAVLVIVYPEDVRGSVNLTLLSLFFGVTATNFPSVLLTLRQCFGKSFDEFDKETWSSDGLQPKQAYLSYVHALNEPHLHEIHVVP
ncbi:hypothetical protein Tco_1096652, partial [Tanacetum coccineum]